MTEQEEIRIWISSCCSGSPGYGGWAWVSRWGVEVKGQAGGERRTTREHMDVAGLAAALQSLADDPGSVPVLVRSASAYLVGGGANQPVEEVELWNRVMQMRRARSGGVTFELARAAAGPKDPFTFVDAWAAFAQQKVKTTGAFTAPIPKSNLRNFPQH